MSEEDKVISYVHYLFVLGKNFADSAEFLHQEQKKTRDFSRFVHTVNLLTSQAVEILPKTIIALDFYLQDRTNTLEQIEKHISTYGHNFASVFDAEPELKKVLNVCSINRVEPPQLFECRNNNEIPVGEYLFNFVSENPEEKIPPTRIKDLQSARYGMFACIKDVGMLNGNDLERALIFLKKLTEEINKLFREKCQEIIRQRK